MAAYGSLAGVAAFVRHMTFDADNQATSADVLAWLDARAAMLTGWLADAGYAVPVTQADATAVLDRYANIGAAGDAELAQRSAGYQAEGEDVRENKFLAEWNRAQAWIAGDALAALGVPRAAGAGNAALAWVPATYRGASVTDEYSRRGC